LSSVRKARTCGSILGSVEGFGAAIAVFVISVTPVISMASFEVAFMDVSCERTTTGALRPGCVTCRELGIAM
jgi:hypothetical protein